MTEKIARLWSEKVTQFVQNNQDASKTERQGQGQKYSTAICIGGGDPAEVLQDKEEGENASAD